MSIALPADAIAVYAPTRRRTLELLLGTLLWLTGLAGAFVFVEPSPYEIMGLVTIIMFVASGLALRAALVPLCALLILYVIGFAIAVIPVLDQPKTLLWVLISLFMAATTLFFAAMLGINTEARLKLLLRGYTAAAVIASIAGIIGYFHLMPGVSGIFLLYDRVRGTFNDPNVLGAFLVLPALLTFQRVLAGRFIEAVRASLLLLLLIAGLFLSFSRGAWGQFAFAAALMMFLTFVTSRSPRERLRIVLFAVLGIMALAAVVAVLLSIPQVADLFKQRAAFEQSYDEGPTGRFGRHALGFLLALDTPLGIGPLQFHNLFPEDPHNAYLNSFMSGGWLSGFAYLTLVAVTLVSGLRFVFIATPWRATYIAVYSAFVGVAGESLIIDSDHWRHYFLILGVLWGLMSVTHGRLKIRRRGQVPPVRAPAAAMRPSLARAAASS
jgi:O-Antigen ligase